MIFSQLVWVYLQAIDWQRLQHRHFREMFQAVARSILARIELSEIILRFVSFDIFFFFFFNGIDQKILTIYRSKMIEISDIDVVS